MIPNCQKKKQQKNSPFRSNHNTVFSDTRPPLCVTLSYFQGHYLRILPTNYLFKGLLTIDNILTQHVLQETESTSVHTVHKTSPGRATWKVILKYTQVRHDLLFFVGGGCVGKGVNLFSIYFIKKITTNMDKILDHQFDKDHRPWWFELITVGQCHVFCICFKGNS